MISRKCWTLALWVSTSLEQPERETVIGDLAESAESGHRALANVLGLVIRRQAVVWRHWHLWAALSIFVLPVSFLLCIVAQNAAGESAVYAWMYANNWDWAMTKSSGFWYEFAHAAGQLSLHCLLVACWSWGAGLLLSCLHKSIQPTTRVAFLLLLALFQIVNAPQHWFHLWMFLSGLLPMPPIGGPNPVTAIAFYRVVFPFLILGTLVALPAIGGMQHQALSAPKKLRPALVIGACVSVMIMLLRVPGFWFLLGASGRQWGWRHQGAMQLVTLIAYWPVLYMVEIGVRRFRGRWAAMA
jgi:hypothetical protein